MDKAQAQVLAQIFDELGNSYNKVTGLLKAYCEANNIDVAEIAPQIAQNPAGVPVKGKKQKKMPRYENVWSADELRKLEEGLKEHKFDVAKVQAHVGTRKAGEVKKYMTQFVKAGVVKNIELPAELAEEDEDSSEDEKSVAPAKPSKKAAAAPVVKKAAAPASAKKAAPAKKQESSDESSDEEEASKKKLPGKRSAPDSDDEESSEEEKPKKKDTKKPEPKKPKKPSSSSSDSD